MQINFGGIDQNVLIKQQMAMQICASHPECKGCELYTEEGLDGTFCENAIYKIRSNNEQN